MFMAIPHYPYLVLKQQGPNDVISLRGDVKWSYLCDKEAIEYAVKVAVSSDRKEVVPLIGVITDKDSDAPAPKKSASIKPVDKVLTKTIDLQTSDPSMTAGSGLDP